MPDLAVVIPVRNESANIEPLLAEIAAALDGFVDYQIICVDDGSTDETPQVLARIAASQPRLKVYRHRPGCGQSQAIATGISRADAPLIATLDGDGQNDPADIPALVRRWQSEPEVTRQRLLIAGWRANRRDTASKKIASRLANAIRGWALKDRTPDTGCGTKLFPRALFLEFPRFNHMHRYLPALTIRAGGSVVSVPVNHRPRREGNSNYGNLGRALVGLPDLLGVMWLMRRPSRANVEDGLT